MAKLTGKFLLQLEDRGEFVSTFDTEAQAKEAISQFGFENVRWQDHPRGETAPFAKVFKNSTTMHPVAVAYPSKDRTLWIWHDPTA